VWSPTRRAAFRFGILVIGLFLAPFPFQLIPGVAWPGEVVSKPLEWLSIWTATHVLGLELPEPRLHNGSGDTTQAYVMNLVIVVLAAVGAAIWSVLDHRRAAYPRLAAAAIIVLRYYLAFMLLGYAFAKLFQFPPPSPTKLDQRIGDLSPMGMLWTFMGASKPYTLFAGFAEGFGAVLLLWRRTHVVGALVAAAAMTNVVALNFCYDVPVKLLSSQMLLIALVIVAPHAPRLLAAVLGRAVPEVPPRPRRSLRAERTRRAAKCLVLSLFAFEIYQDLQVADQRQRPRHELHGSWFVDRYVQDGVERPPLLTDTERPHKIYFTEFGVFARTMTGPLLRLGTGVDPAARTIAIRPTPDPGLDETWTYELSTDGDHATLVVGGTLYGKRIHAELHREPAPLLFTRGFHWVNEVPYNK
jgi:hypothetical protein